VAAARHIAFTMAFAVWTHIWSARGEPHATTLTRTAVPLVLTFGYHDPKSFTAKSSTIMALLLSWLASMESTMVAVDAETKQ